MKRCFEWLLAVGGVLVLVVPPSLAYYYDWPWPIKVICWFPLAYVIGVAIVLSWKPPWS